MFAALSVAVVGCSDPAPTPVVNGVIGEIQVDPLTETTYVQRFEGEGCRAPVYAISAGELVAQQVTDPGCRIGVRLLFTRGGLLVLSQDEEGRDRLEAFDRTTLEPLANVESEWSLGARVSQSGRFVAGISRVGASIGPLTIIDSDTLEITVMMPDRLGGVAWLPDRDALLVLTYSGSAEAPSLRLRGWDVTAVAARGFSVLPDGTWPDPFFDVSVPGYGRWPSLDASPDGHTVVISVERRDPVENWARDLVFVDLETSAFRIFPEATGRPTFTPDGDTVVVSTSLPQTGREPILRMLLIDVDTLSSRGIDPPGDGGRSELFLARDGRSMVVTVHDGWLYNGRTSTLALALGARPTVLDVPLRLDERATRSDDVWILSDHVLYRLTPGDGELEAIELPFSPLQIAALPLSDRLVISDLADPTLVHFFDPGSRTLVGAVSLPPLRAE